MKRALLAATVFIGASPAWAQADPLAPAPEQQQQPNAAPSVQPQVPLAAPVTPRPQPVVVIPRDWRGVFVAIRSGNWLAAQAGIATLPADVLTPVAKAELYTAKGSPVVSLAQLQALLAEASDLPQADQLARMAQTRGATNILLPIKYGVVGLGSAPRRARARVVQGEPLADQLRKQFEPYVEANDPVGAEALLTVNGPMLSFEARAEAGQRVAWAYYVVGRDADARRVADTWRPGAVGEWAQQASWVSGLASWRMNDCNAASRAFRETAVNARERELSTAGYYWAARAEQACRRPVAVAPLLKAAARSPESFYGLVARETLGMDTRLPSDQHNHSPRVENIPNVRRAAALVAIGEQWLAEDMLRHQARIGRAAEHHGLIEFAKRLDLAGAQFWLAHFGQPGAAADATDRYPLPRWAPLTGWRVDPALAFAHARQESNFRADAVSQVGAVGLMQVRPGTAADMARDRNLPYSRARLTDPAVNLEYGQSFIELIRRANGTRGQLPRVIAAYNAGPVPVERWLYIPDAGDPLQWIESLPYWETRYYVPAVLRNMWVYQGLANSGTPTLTSIAQHRWPSFPTGRTHLSR